MDDAPSPTSDEIFEILSSSRRRYLLYHLYERGGSADLRTLAEDTAHVEFGSPLTEEQIKRIYIAFYQTHVPKLESVGFVQYDRDNQRVTLDDSAAMIATILPAQEQSGQPWPRYYLALALGGSLLTGISYFDLLGIGSVLTVAAVATIISISLLLLTVWYYLEYHVREDKLAFLERLIADDSAHSSTE